MRVVALEEHPGYLGFTSQGVIAIHADWPAYPLEHGAAVALTSLGIFPLGSQFQVIDDIDRCALMVATDYLTDSRDLFSEKNLHVALWHEDLLAASDAGWITGLERITEREHEQRKRDAHREALIKAAAAAGVVMLSGDPLDHLVGITEEGERIPIELPPLDRYDDEDDLPPGWLGTSGKPVRLTADGLNELEQLWSNELQVPEMAQGRVQPLIEIGAYDTALREIGVLLESTMRSAVSDADGLYGVRLGEAFVRELVASRKYVASGLKSLRGEIRTVFKFVRNRFAHDTVDLARAQALALISRTCHLLGEVDELASALKDR